MHCIPVCCFLIFCLNYLSITENEVVKSPTTIVLLSISSLRFVNVYFVFLSALILGACMFIIVISIDKLILLSFCMTFFVSCDSFDLNSILFCICKNMNKRGGHNSN